MNNWIKIFTATNGFVFRVTNGRLGSKLGRQSILLLHTRGRKSGKSYTTSLSYYRDGKNYVLVGTNWGNENHPDWYLNLLQNPRTTIQVGATIIPVEARQAQEDEYVRLWELVTHQNKQYLQYQKGMMRRIPIVILTPTTSV
ncbi:MAG: nitroreductase family deazaflavin-dependent oxidoreductase [Anaerolineales bacterium]|jgi:deazaflavin-dependent oxidoreductase (nitroreductase family)